MADLEAQIATALSDISGLEATTAILTSGQARIDGEVDAVESGLSTTNAEIVQLAVSFHTKRKHLHAYDFIFSSQELCSLSWNGPNGLIVQLPVI